MKKMKLFFVIMIAVLAVAPAVAIAGQWDNDGKGPCWTWGNVVGVRLTSQVYRGVGSSTLNVDLRDWNDETNWFEYFTVVVRDTRTTPLSAIHQQVASALGNLTLAVQVKTVGACWKYLYNPTEIDVYDVTPIEVQPIGPESPPVEGGGGGSTTPQPKG